MQVTGTKPLIGLGGARAVPALARIALRIGIDMMIKWCWLV